MNVIQQLSDFLSCKTDTVVTILMTLVIFISGILVNVIIIIARNLYDRLNYRRFFKELIVSICFYTNKQAVAFDKFKQSLRMDNQGTFYLSRYIENSLNTFDKLSIDKIYDSYFQSIRCNNKIRRKAFRFILNNTQLIRDINCDLPLDTEKMIMEFSKYENEWHKTTDDIRKIFDELRQHFLANSIKQEYMPLFTDLNKVFVDWKNVGYNSNRKVIKEVIVDAIFNNIIGKYKSIDIVVNLENLTIDATMAYRNMENIISLYSNLFSGYHRIFVNYERKMKVALKVMGVKI